VLKRARVAADDTNVLHRKRGGKVRGMLEICIDIARWGGCGDWRQAWSRAWHGHHILINKHNTGKPRVVDKCPRQDIVQESRALLCAHIHLVQASRPCATGTCLV
jgi:hypothetical protein